MQAITVGANIIHLCFNLQIRQTNVVIARKTVIIPVNGQLVEIVIFENELKNEIIVKIKSPIFSTQNVSKTLIGGINPATNKNGVKNRTSEIRGVIMMFEIIEIKEISLK